MDFDQVAVNGVNSNSFNSEDTEQLRNLIKDVRKNGRKQFRKYTVFQNET